MTTASPIPHHDRTDADFTPNLRRHVLLRDGRWLEVVEFGDPEGMPLLTFHGSPGSCLEAAMYGAAGRACGVRVIAFSRPGFGRSSRLRGREIADVVEDAAELLDDLGIERLALSGYSAGCAYAVACAAAWPERVTALGLLAPAAPRAITGVLPSISLPILASNGFGYAIAARIPPLRRAIAAVAHRTGDFRGLPDASADAFLASLSGAFAQGPWAAIRDLWLVLRPWRVDLAALRIPTVVWQGRRDAVVGWAGTSRLARRIPGVVFRTDEGANHFSVVTRHVDELLAELRALSG